MITPNLRKNSKYQENYLILLNSNEKRTKNFKTDCFILVYIFQGERSFFQFPIFPEYVLKNTENKKNASIPGASFGFSMYLSTNSGKTEN